MLMGDCPGFRLAVATGSNWLAEFTQSCRSRMKMPENVEFEALVLGVFESKAGTVCSLESNSKQLEGFASEGAEAMSEVKVIPGPALKLTPM